MDLGSKHIVWIIMMYGRDTEVSTTEFNEEVRYE
jgi:hypothetical protein